jgi:hypothetical protein
VDVAAEPQQETLSFALHEKTASSYGDRLAKPAMTPSVLESSSEQTGSPATRLLSSVRQILLQELAEAQTEGQVAALLRVSKSQAKAWLIQLVEEGTLKKLSKPVRFRAAKPSDQLL